MILKVYITNWHVIALYIVFNISYSKYSVRLYEESTGLSVCLSVWLIDANSPGFCTKKAT